MAKSKTKKVNQSFFFPKQINTMLLDSASFLERENSFNRKRNDSISRDDTPLLYDWFKEAFSRGFVRFAFAKVNGDFRVATGTLCQEILEDVTFAIKKNERTGERVVTDNIQYFDMDKEDFRSFTFQRLLYIDKDFGSVPEMLKITTFV